MTIVRGRPRRASGASTRSDRARPWPLVKGRGRCSALVRRRHDQHRAAGMLGDLVRDAALELLADALQAPRAEHDHGRVDLVRHVYDALPERLLELGPRLGLEPGLTRAIGPCARLLQGAVRA